MRNSGSRSVAAAALGLALGVTLGCATAPSPPLVVECKAADPSGRSGTALVGVTYGLQHSPLPLDSVQYADSRTASRVAVQGIYAERTVTDTVQVTARLVSCLDAPSSVKVRTAFMRASQAPAEPTSAWRVVHLPPRAISHYDELSTSRDVAAYIIEVAAE